jgi:hypothetical protein
VNLVIEVDSLGLLDLLPLIDWIQLNARRIG